MGCGPDQYMYIFAVKGMFTEHLHILSLSSLSSCDSHIVSLIRANVRNRWSVHELFGFDVMLDQRLHPWLL